MINQKIISILIIIILSFSSCVSKKKFLEMQEGRTKAEQKVRELTTENNYMASRIEALISDFETMKNELMESNAIKDQYIDSLNNELFALRNTLEEQKESLKETSFSFGFERQRMIEEMKIKDKTISSLKSRIGDLEDEIARQASVIDDKNFQMGLLSDRISSLQADKEQAEQRIEELNGKLSGLREQISLLNATLEEKNATITRLQNNVKLLKQELGGN